MLIQKYWNCLADIHVQLKPYIVLILNAECAVKISCLYFPPYEVFYHQPMRKKKAQFKSKEEEISDTHVGRRMVLEISVFIRHPVCF